MSEFKLDRVWISSVDHLDEMRMINKGTKWWKQLLGIQKIKSDFPQVRTGVFVLPLVYYSTGTIEVDASRLHYIANAPEYKPKVFYHNTNDTLQFTVEADQIEDVEIYKYPQPFLKSFNYPWVKVILKNGKVILVSSEMKTGEVERGLKATAALYKCLQNYVT